MRQKRIELIDLEARYTDFCRYMHTVKQTTTWHSDLTGGRSND